MLDDLIKFKYLIDKDNPKCRIQLHQTGIKNWLFQQGSISSFACCICPLHDNCMTQNHQSMKNWNYHQPVLIIMNTREVVDDYQHPEEE